MRFLRRLSTLVGPGRDHGLRDEIEFHRERLRAEGLTAAEAERRLGSDLRIREDSRDAWGWLWLEQLGQDLRGCGRQWRRAPGAAAAAVLVLALAIGAGTALFSVMDAVLLRPLPYRQPGRLVELQGESGLQRVPGEAAATPQLMLRPASWLQRLRTLSGWATMEAGTLTVGVQNGRLPEVVPAAEVTPGLFALLGVHPLGRAFRADDAKPGHDPVAIVRADLAARLGGVRAVLGHEVRLNGAAFRVVGIAPATCNLPRGTRIWIPMPNPWNFDHETMSGSAIFFDSIARLRPGATPAAALAEVLRAQALPVNEQRGIAVVPLQASQAAGSAAALWLLLAAVGAVLLAACANVAGLQLTQSLRRRSELAVRLALGATRGRLARQALVEALVLALAGGGIGCLLAAAGMGTLRAFLPAGLPLAGPPALDGRVLGFALAATGLSALLVGVPPALAFGGKGASSLALAAGVPGAGGLPRRAARLRAALVIFEVALATVLLGASGLLRSSLQRLTAVNPGFSTGGLLTAKLSLTGPRYASDAGRADFYRGLRARLAAIPGVEAAALGTNLPLNTGATFTVRVQARGRSAGSYYSEVGPGFFQALGAPLLAGHDFAGEDYGAPSQTAIVSRSLAAALFPHRDPIGRRLELPHSGNTTWSATIVGVAADTRLHLAGQAARNIYLPLAALPVDSVAVILRTHGDPNALAAPLRRTLAGMDPGLALAQIRTMRELVDAASAGQRFRGLLLAVFAGLALLLSVTGLGAALAHSAAIRTREIGVRMALGARPAQAAGMMLAQSVRLTGLGLALGLAGALAAARLLRQFLFGVGPYDPLIWLGSAASLAAAALLASWWPARRAARVDPLAALRCE
jgi:predicted permease